MTTKECMVSPGTYMRHLSLMFLADNWLWMVLPVAVCAVLAAWFDVRFVIVALMVLFVALPIYCTITLPRGESGSNVSA